MSEGEVGSEGGGEAGGLAAALGSISGGGEPSGVVDQAQSADPGMEVPDWAKSFESQELQNLVATKKYADVEQLAQAYQHASSKLGADPEKILSLPDWEDEESAGKFFDAVGRPEEASQYTMLEGMDAGDQAIGEQMRDAMYREGLTDKQWQGVQKEFQRVGAEGLRAMEAQQAEQLAIDDAALKTAWGADYEGNLQLGVQALKQMGLPDGVFEGLKQIIGLKGVAEFGFEMSKTFVEHQVVNDGGGLTTPVSGGMSPEAAKREYDGLLKNPEFVKLKNSGDPAAADKVYRLKEIINSGQQPLA